MDFDITISEIIVQINKIMIVRTFFWILAFGLRQGFGLTGGENDPLWASWNNRGRVILAKARIQPV